MTVKMWRRLCPTPDQDEQHDDDDINLCQELQNFVSFVDFQGWN